MRNDIYHPEFELNNEGNVWCKTYSRISYFKDHPSLNLFIMILFKSMRKQCMFCVHYKNDDCYFPKSALKAISRDLGWSFIFSRSKFKCDICGKRIIYMSNVLYKFYMKEIKNVEIAQLCCTCYDALEKGKDYQIVSRLKRPLLFLIYAELVIFIMYKWIMSSSNSLRLLISLSIPLILGIIIIGIKIRRGYKRKTYIKRLNT